MPDVLPSVEDVARELEKWLADPSDCGHANDPCDQPCYDCIIARIASTLRVREAAIRREVVDSVNPPEVIAALRCVRTLDCGVHYCRYCPAKSPEWWHVSSCPYVESQRDYELARRIMTRLRTLAGEDR